MRVASLRTVVRGTGALGWYPGLELFGVREKPGLLGEGLLGVLRGLAGLGWLLRGWLLRGCDPGE